MVSPPETAYEKLRTFPYPIIRVVDMAECTGKPLRTLRYHIAKGALPARNIGLRGVYVDIGDALEYVGLKRSDHRPAQPVSAPPVTGPRCGVYFIRCGEAVKIGISRDVGRRLGEVSDFVPFEVTLMAMWPTPDIGSAKRKERQLHQRFQASRIKREWFRLDPDVAEFIAGVARSFNDNANNLPIDALPCAS